MQKTTHITTDAHLKSLFVSYLPRFSSVGWFVNRVLPWYVYYDLFQTAEYNADRRMQDHGILCKGILRGFLGFLSIKEPIEQPIW